MFIHRFKQRVVELRKEPEDVRVRAAVKWTALSGGALAVLWISVLLPLQVGSFFNDSTDPASETGVVSGIQDPAPVTTAVPTPATQLYQGTRPTQRQPSNISAYEPTSAPTPTTLPVAAQAPESALVEESPSPTPLPAS